MKSNVADQLATEVDVVLLRARYTAALERYCAYAAKLAEHGGVEPPPVHLLEAERQTLQEFASMRAALLKALVVPVESQIEPGFLHDCRDEAIRRSIAKRNETASARMQYIERRLKRARLFAVASTGSEPAGRSDEPAAVDDQPVS